MRLPIPPAIISAIFFINFIEKMFYYFIAEAVGFCLKFLAMEEIGFNIYREKGREPIDAAMVMINNA